MADKDCLRSSVDPAIDDLKQAKSQLDEALKWLRDGHTTATAVALAQEVRLLCQQAALSDNPILVEFLLSDVKAKLSELEMLLRRH